MHAAFSFWSASFLILLSALGSYCHLAGNKYTVHLKAPAGYHCFFFFLDYHIYFLNKIIFRIFQLYFVRIA